MADPWYRGLRRSAALLACLACVLALPAGSAPAGDPAAHPPPAATAPDATAAVTHPPLRVLQLNLCNSGLPRCYTGRSVAGAAAVIRDQLPDVVTLNEVCESDVDTLAAAMVDLYAGQVVAHAFAAAGDRRTGGDTECLTGESYGNGLLVRMPEPYRGHTVHRGIFRIQDPLDPEERAWLCVHATSAFYACTTHLSYITRWVPRAQCAHLLRRLIPRLRVRGGHGPVVLAGDFNLRAPVLRSCLPAGYLAADDGSVQYVVASTDYGVRETTVIDMAGTTDHPGLLVSLTGTRGPPAPAGGPVG